MIKISLLVSMIIFGVNRKGSIKKERPHEKSLKFMSLSFTKAVFTFIYRILC